MDGKDFKKGDKDHHPGRAKRHTLGEGGDNNKTCLGSKSISVFAAEKK